MITRIKRLIKKITPACVIYIYRKISAIYFSWFEKRVYLSGKSEAYLKRWYKKRIGEELDLVHPKTYTAKQQWLKLYGQSELKTMCSDKWLVRDYIKDRIGPDILIPIIKNNGKELFEDAFDIVFEELPESFVVQCNHGSGMTFVINDKNKLGVKGFKAIQKKLNAFLKKNYAFCNGLELVYKDIKPAVFITKYLTIGGDLPDYKIMCFNGEPQFIWVDTERFVEHKRSVYYLDFTEAPFNMHTYKRVEGLEKPVALDKMIEYSRVLAKDFSDYVRIDFYYADNQIWFGELSFSSTSGTELPHPPEWNIKIGQMLKLPCDNE